MSLNMLKKKRVKLAQILFTPGFIAVSEDLQNYQQTTPTHETIATVPEPTSLAKRANKEQVIQGGAPSIEEGKQTDELRGRDMEDVDRESNIPDGDVSCLATCTASDMDEDPLRSYSYEAEEGENEGLGPLTSCVGTLWFRAPELLYGSTSYGPEIDLWSLGCIFAELLSLEPLFPGASDVDQLVKIINILGNLSEGVWPGCVELPDYSKISFGKVENPVGLEACLPDRCTDGILLVKKLLCYEPTSRATAMELLQDKYFNEEPLPSP